MGGVIDGLGSGLEGIHYNPALTATLTDFGFMLNFNPLPNDVSLSTLSVGSPLLGGVIAGSAQFLNTGGFTYINQFLQAEESVSVYDTAASVGYSRVVWNDISAGATIRTIYRVLGDYNAFAVGGDVGAAYWFETPHFGQRPKPPKDKKLEKEFLDKKKALDSEREKRLKEATKTVQETQSKISALEKDLGEISAKITAAAEEKKPPLQEKEEKIQKDLKEAQKTLSAETDKSQVSTSEAEKWYSRELKAAEDAYAKKLSNLKYVETERTRLYLVVDDPDKELTEDKINASIDETIDKTQVFLNDRAISLEEVQENYQEIRKNRIGEIQNEINSYKKQIDEELGPEIKKLEDELASLNTEKETLESQEEADKEKVQELQKRIGEKERELATAKGDPWIKRLESRIGEKEKEIQELNEDIEKKEGETQKATEELIKSIQKDIDNFNMMRDFLNRELKKAKLKRELDLLNAKNDKKKEKALSVYKERERIIYLRLLSLIYKHEEKILNARVDARTEDYESRVYDLQTQSQKELERLEDEFSFQKRFLDEKISDLEKITKIKSEDVDEGAVSELNDLKEELSTKEDAFGKAADELEEKEKKSLRDEEEQFDKNVAELKWEIKLTRLIYLQTDDPYRNTSVNAAIQNVGSNVKFEEEGFPLPTTFHVGLGYAILNTDTHAVKLGVQMNVPFYNDISVGVGAEYGFLDMFFFRTGYTFNAINRNISLGAGAKLAIGFTSYAVDYAFQPLPDYGYLHNIGVSAYF
jgi:chromosome segregation ATPase